jgi:hypothetical protein
MDRGSVPAGWHWQAPNKSSPAQPKKGTTRSNKDSDNKNMEIQGFH